MNERIQLFKGDCLIEMLKIPNKSVDMILCDLPYGTTACRWDEIIPFDKLWEQYDRIIKDNGVIALFGSEPFSTKLRFSNLKWFRYDWIWNKGKGANFQLAKKQPLKFHEIISIFSKNSPRYFPQGTKELEKPLKCTNKNKAGRLGHLSSESKRDSYYQTITNYPRSILDFKGASKPIHPTQKPIELLEYLIRTYTLENEVVLDNTMGSGSTGVACINTNRRFIGIEMDDNYFEIACNRINEALKEG